MLGACCLPLGPRVELAGGQQTKGPAARSGRGVSIPADPRSIG